MDNMTRESINVGEFNKKQYFHFCILQFLNISDIVEQGNIVKHHLEREDFLLLPRTTVAVSSGKLYTSLFIMWTDEEFDPQGIISLRDSINKMITKENNMSTQNCLFFNNGKRTEYIMNRWEANDFSFAKCSYLITHQYKENKFVYRITSSTSFKEHFKHLQRYNLNENTILDLVFTGRSSNSYYNCYNFCNYKIKDSFISDEIVILSNVRGVVDLTKVVRHCRPWTHVMLYNFLLDWKNPTENKPDYYMNMPIKIINFYPQDLIEVRDNQLYFKNNRIDRCNSGTYIKVVLPKENIYETLYDLYNRGVNAANERFLTGDMTIEEVIKKFDSKRIEREKKNFQERKLSLKRDMASLRRSLDDLEENKIILENRVKSFIPFPKIILPKEKPESNVVDLMPLLKVKDNQYYIEED